MPEKVRNYEKSRLARIAHRLAWRGGGDAGLLRLQITGGGIPSFVHSVHSVHSVHFNDNDHDNEYEYHNEYDIGHTYKNTCHPLPVTCNCSRPEGRPVLAQGEAEEAKPWPMPPAEPRVTGSLPNMEPCKGDTSMGNPDFEFCTLNLERARMARVKFQVRHKPD